jgi:hypothetical protein
MSLENRAMIKNMIDALIIKSKVESVFDRSSTRNMERHLSDPKQK